MSNGGKAVPLNLSEWGRMQNGRGFVGTMELWVDQPRPSRPGTFVWFPAGEVITHGAGPTEGMVAIFISGAPFKIEYVSR